MGKSIIMGILIQREKERTRMSNMTESKRNLMHDTRTVLQSGKRKLTETFHDIKNIVVETKLVKVTMVHPVLAFIIIGICMAICLIGGFIVLHS